MNPRIIISLLYAAIFGVYGVTTPFTPLILKELGLIDQEINLALSMFGLAALSSPLLISHFADRSFSVRRIMTALLVVNLFTIPLWLSATKVLVAAVITFIFYATILPALTLLDAYTVGFTLADREDNQKAAHYQSYRIWGSIGFIIPTLLFAFISRRVPIDSLIMIVVATLLSLISVMLAWKLPENIPARGAPGAPSGEALRAALRPPLRGIFISTAITGIALSMFYIAFPRFLQELGNSPENVGLISSLGVVAEIALMPFTARLIRLMTARTLILLAIATVPVRFLLITLWPTNEMVIMTQWLHAPLVIGLFISIPIFLGEVAHHSFRFSLQSLNSTLTLGVSRMIGPWLGALVIQQHGGTALDGLRMVLMVAALLSTIGFCTLYLSASSPKSANGSIPSPN